tara:strand:- start:208 stop:816 length:609 start_codon:yes stop_codon:yes gene_type:complete
MLFIGIEGDIGAGKTTAIAHLKATFARDCRIAFVDEPVAEWERLGLLDGVYGGGLSKGTFQHHALMSRIGPVARAFRDGASVVISERSPLTDADVFARTNLSGLEFTAYRATYDKIMDVLPPAIEWRFVFLEAPLGTLLARISARGRAAEAAVDAEYVRALQRAHAAFATVQQHRLRKVDASRSATDVAHDVEVAVRTFLGD